jgi:hypothetical protein
MSPRFALSIIPFGATAVRDDSTHRPALARG